MIPQWVIERKRDGRVLEPDEIRTFITAFTDGTLPDYQMSALAMAIFFQGMTDDETTVLTDVMMRSGDQIDFSGWPRPTADKHSTGGIGDHLSLMIAPLAASAGLAVPMISGRGLGITGGTLDKLESIPGYDTRLSVERFKAIVAEVGCSIIGQTDRLAPADKKLYALRDVTGTVPSIPLITASIMSKKLAEGAQTLVFDVKCGRAAFMKTPEQAHRLAMSLMRVGRTLNRRTAALVTDMDQPLGRAAGHAVEMAAAIETLQGRGAEDTRRLTIELTAQMTVLAGVHADLAAARAVLTRHLDEGLAWAIFCRMVEAHGGDRGVLDDPMRLPQPGAILDVPSPLCGYVAEVDAEAVGRIVLQLGGGRTKTDDVIDVAVGVDRLVQSGEPVDRGQPLMRLLAKDDTSARARVAEAIAAVTITPTPPIPQTLILSQLTN